MSLSPTPSEVSGVEHTTARWFAEEVEPHEPRLRAWLTGRFPMLQDVDDVVQDAYMRLFRARDKGGVRSVRAFLFIAAHNAACDVFRRQPPEFIEHLEDLAAEHVFESKPDAAEVASTNHEIEFLAEAMRSLPERCRQVFTLRKIFGLSQKEIAAQLGIAEHTVEVQINKGACRCKKFLQARGITR